MALKNNELKLEYSSDVDDIANVFVKPCMENASIYDRLTGYFSSSIYILIWPALKEFIKRGGKIRIICSPVLYSNDADALSTGYKYRLENSIEDELNNELRDLFSNKILSKPAKLLACLVGLKVIDVRIVNTNIPDNPAIKRLFHEKVGIFRDEEGTAVVFRGSMNETLKGLSPQGNIESISVYTNSEDGNDIKRVNEAINHFDRLWNNNVTGINVSSFPDSSLEILTRESQTDNWEELLDDIIDDIQPHWTFSKPDICIVPKAHQVTSLNNWFNNNRRGIFEHATGSGKTITAILAIEDSLNRGEISLVIVPSVALLKQWKELLAYYLSNETKLFICGDSNNQWKENSVLRSWTDPGIYDKRVILSTIDTASSDQFINSIKQGEHIFVVVDEVHCMGSRVYSNITRIDTGPRLGLSATPKRFGDPEGTEIILEYFHGIIQPPFTLYDAIQTGVLSKYYYYPQTVYLTAEEQENWDIITVRIKKQLAIDLNGDNSQCKISDRLKHLLIDRARIAKQASEKVQLALDVIKKNYKYGQKWLVYCDDQKQLNQVTNLLNEKGYDAYVYHSAMPGDREATLEYFKVVGGIIVSIQCLDEGVDIPDATHALVLASSRNPREFIQRRGRILRLSQNKHFAHLFDAVVLPLSFDSPDRNNILINELSRCAQFGLWASNPKCITDLQLLCVKHGIDIDILSNGGFEDE